MTKPKVKAREIIAYCDANKMVKYKTSMANTSSQ